MSNVDDCLCPELWEKEIITTLEENMAVSSLIYNSIPRARPQLFTREISAVSPVVIYPEGY